MTEKTNGMLYSSFNTENKDQIVQSYSDKASQFNVVTRQKPQEAIAIQLTDNINIRGPFNKPEYDMYRPNERLPFTFRDVIKACRVSYLKNGVVRNVIDMMTDFATEDFRFIHPDKKVEAFFKVWSNKIKLKNSLDEFVRHFLIDGNVVVKRTMAKLSQPVETQWQSKSDILDDSIPVKLYKEPKNNKREIPWQYTFLNVAALYWIGGEATKMAGERRLGFRPSATALNIIKSPNEPFQRQIVDRMPMVIKDKIVNSESGLIELDMSTLYVGHNKKDSWEDWAPPFLYSILSELSFRDKLRQAELSALDGMINVIRLWKLGDHKEGFLPNGALVEKLINILEANTGGGAMDIVWDDMIDMEEFYPPVDQILGSEKYDQVNRDILIGLGVPEVLIGGKGGNFSNSWIQLRTMVERLQFIRDNIITWLNDEVQKVCEAMGFEIPPKIHFNEMNLEDENATRKLIIGLLDRGIISIEAVLDIYGEDFLMEIERIRNEKKLGIKVKSPLDNKPTKSGNNNGRPPFANDTQTRDTRKAKPRRGQKSYSELMVFAMDAIDSIDTYVIPLYMENLNVSNARKLTSEQKDEINIVRTNILSCINHNDDLSEDGILTIAENSKPNIATINIINAEINDFTSRTGQIPTLNQRKRLEAAAWASINGDNNG